MTTMRRRQLGRQGLRVSAIGLGVMGMSEFYGPADERENRLTLERALRLGVTFWDTADVYGCGANERLVGTFLRHTGERDRITLATKFGILRDHRGRPVGVSGAPDYVGRACEASLQRLETDRIDLYYLHRVDPSVPIEETVGAMATLVTAGKVGALGLSEVSGDTLRRAHSIHPITAVQTEYSLWSRDPEKPDGILTTCSQLGVGFVAYSPLGRGFLSGRVKQLEDLAADDYRRTTPRFQRRNFTTNLELLGKIEAIAIDKGCSPAQLALAWLLRHDDGIVPIPGTKHDRYLEENVAALDVELDRADLDRIDRAMPAGAAAGARYTELGMRFTDN